MDPTHSLKFKYAAIKARHDSLTSLNKSSSRSSISSLTSVKDESSAVFDRLYEARPKRHVVIKKKSGDLMYPTGPVIEDMKGKMSRSSLASRLKSLVSVI